MASPARFLRNVVLKALFLFVALNAALAAVDPLPALGRVSAYNVLLPGRARLPYGENPARDVVIQLLVDDGVPDRGHRNNILDGNWGVEGVACGPHRDYRQICVMNYAVKYVER